jgi:hypothetical protein
MQSVIIQGHHSDGQGMDPSFDFQSFLYFTLEGYTPNAIPSQGFPAAVINFGDLSGWFDFNLSFFGTASSSSCNPYGIVIVPTTDIYPYSNYKLLYENLIGFTWTTGTNSYAGQSGPGVLDKILKIGTGPGEHQTPVQPNVNYYIWFAMNDNDVLANVMMTLSWRTQAGAPPGTVISLTGLNFSGP